jgi:hypothetical protein
MTYNNIRTSIVPWFLNDNLDFACLICRHCFQTFTCGFYHFHLIREYTILYFDALNEILIKYYKKWLVWGGIKYRVLFFWTWTHWTPTIYGNHTQLSELFQKTCHHRVCRLILTKHLRTSIQIKCSKICRDVNALDEWYLTQGYGKTKMLLSVAFVICHVIISSRRVFLSIEILVNTKTQSDSLVSRITEALINSFHTRTFWWSALNNLVFDCIWKKGLLFDLEN